MLSENLTRFRKMRGMTQEALALQLNVVRQTVSKWEKGLSVPDAEMLVEISQRLDVPVSTLLSETIEPSDTEDAIQLISDKLALLNEQLAKAAERRRRWVRSFSYAGFAAVGCYLVWQIVAMVNTHTFPYQCENAGISVIGGADGPTSVFVYSSGINIAGIIGIAVILLISAFGIFLTRRNRA